VIEGGSPELNTRMVVMALIALVVLACPVATKTVEDGVQAGKAVSTVSVVAGPQVLHASTTMQWGGHTFGYLLEGRKSVIWGARYFDPSAPVHGMNTAIIGQYPKPSSDTPAASTLIQCTESNVTRVDQPYMVRTPDGYIHIFADYYVGNSGQMHGHIRYYRSSTPEDIRKLVQPFKSPSNPNGLVPEGLYAAAGFHCRMNVGISPDGKHMVIIALATRGKGNLPVLWRGTRRGRDFTFAGPTQYLPDWTALFYPQISLTNQGEVFIVAENWNEPAYCKSTLLHLDANNNLVHREDLPQGPTGSHVCYDLRPRSGNDRSRLILYAVNSVSETVNTHELWQYDLAARQLTLLSSFEGGRLYGNPGKWLPFASGGSVMINNPCLGRLATWEGNLLAGQAEMKIIPGADPISLGYTQVNYVMAPNPIYGSIVSNDRDFYIMSDCKNPNPPDNTGRPGEESGTFSLLLWRMRENVQRK